MPTGERWRRLSRGRAERLATPAGTRNGVGIIERLRAGDLTDSDARSSGFDHAQGLRTLLGDPSSDEQPTRVDFQAEHVVDPHLELRNRVLDDATLADLQRRLSRLDALRPALDPGRAGRIRSQPGTRAADLARQSGRETLPFKADVRKLKSLGLTRSLEVGYDLSSLGAAFLGGIGR